MKKSKMLLASCLMLCGGASFAQVITPNGSGVVFVNKTVSGGTQSGNSWTNAVPELADALLAAKSDPTITQIWVAKGTYIPMYSAVDTTFGADRARNNAFRLVNNVAVYGGFQNANETSISQRDTVTNNTILSGDRGTPNDTTDNCYHVVVSSNTTGILDGFTITRGVVGPCSTAPMINGVQVQYNLGGGIAIFNSSLQLSNCTITGNYARACASAGGGGMAISLPTSATAFPVITRCIISNNVGGTAGGGGVYSTGQNTAAGVTPTLFVNCTFSGNSTGGQGGAVYNISSGQLFVNTLFINNTAAGNGGALSGLLASKASFINCTLFGNTTSTSTSGGIYAIATPPNSSITIYNSILWGNSNIQGKQVSLAKGAGTVSITVSNSIVQDTTVWAGTGNSNGNPLFTDTLANIFTLQCSSPAFNTGDNSLYYGNINADKDLGGDMRLANGVIDMGAYEFSRSGNHTVLPVSICQGDSYTFNGTTYDTSNYTATDTLVNQYGCDSIITLNLTVHPTPAAPVITHNGDNLSATPGYSSYQWLLNGDEIFNALDSTYTATQNGIYSIRVTDSNGCTAVSDTLHITVGIPEVSAQSVLVYPNPAVGGYLHISSSLPVNAAITTIDGKQVMTRNNAQTIDLSNLAAGTYFLKMTDAQGRFIKAERIVVAKQR